jgi:hypothetical protein
MSTAVGVHAVPGRVLGLRPADPALPALELGDFLTGVVPPTPAAADYIAGVSFGNYMNDRFGVCGPVSVANSRRSVTARLAGAMRAPTQDDVFDLYRRSGNPNFNPATGADDNGVNMQVMLTALVRGGIGGVKPLGFARVGVKDWETLQAAVAVFGFLLYGVDLQQAQQAQTDAGTWDYRPSGVWGGHAVLGGAFASSPAELIDVVTWGKRVRMTPRFVGAQLSEAWAVVWPEHLTDKGFLAGVNLPAFASAYEAITGKPFPAPVPPPPAPAVHQRPGRKYIPVSPWAHKLLFEPSWFYLHSTGRSYNPHSSSGLLSDRLHPIALVLVFSYLPEKKKNNY